MGLSMHERRVLSQIEYELTRDDPLLAAQLASLGPSAERPRTGWRKPPPMSNRLRRVLIAALAALAGLSLLLVGRVTSTGVDDPGQRPDRTAEACRQSGPGPGSAAAEQPRSTCVGKPAYYPPDGVYPYGGSEVQGP